MSDVKLAKFVRRVGVVVGKEARKAGLKPQRFDGAILEDGILLFTVDMAGKAKELH